MSTTYTVDADGKFQIDKRQRSRLDFGLNWAPWLTPLGDSIVTVDWTHSAGVTLTDETNSTTLAEVFVTGGAVDTVEWITCQITTANVPPRIEERTIYLNILPR